MVFDNVTVDEARRFFEKTPIMVTRKEDEPTLIIHGMSDDGLIYQVLIDDFWFDIQRQVITAISEDYSIRVMTPDGDIVCTHPAHEFWDADVVSTPLAKINKAKADEAAAKAASEEAHKKWLERLENCDDPDEWWY